MDDWESKPYASLSSRRQDDKSIALIQQIIYCEADSNYTRFHLENGELYMVSKTLGDVQEGLETRDFVRVRRRFIANLEHIQRLVKGEGAYLLLTNGITIPVARQQKDRLMERFGWL